MEPVIHNLIQGSAAWHAHREACLNASDAAAMLGISPYQSRSELIHAKATGAAREVTADQQARFNDGHAFEAIARAWAEEIIGKELGPITASLEVDGLPLSASYDGVTMNEDVLFEHKTLNQALRESLPRGEIPDQYKPQMEQQLLILGAEKCLFMASNGDRETMLHAWYTSDPALRQRLLAGWAQFQKDVAAYQPQEYIPAPTAEPIKDLPALAIQISGRVVASNLKEWRDIVTERIAAIKTDLQDDQDFADAAKMVTFLDEGEKRIALVKQQAQAQATSIDEVFRALDEIRETMRAKRLALNTSVVERKAGIRAEILGKGKTALTEHIAALNTRIGKPWMPAIAADFAGAMRGLRTVKSLREAVETCLASAKIEASAVADRITLNIRAQAELAAEHGTLFPDSAQLVQKAPDDFLALVKNRVAEHLAAEERKREAERERIRKEEEARAARAAEAKAKAEAERVARQTEEEARAAEQKRLAEERAQAAPPVPMSKRASAPSGGGFLFTEQAHPTSAPRRPTDAEIIAALAREFMADQAEVIDWLTDMAMAAQAT